MAPFGPSCLPRAGTDLEGAGHLFRAFRVQVGADFSIWPYHGYSETKHREFPNGCEETCEN